MHYGCTVLVIAMVQLQVNNPSLCSFDLQLPVMQQTFQPQILPIPGTQTTPHFLLLLLHDSYVEIFIFIYMQVVRIGQWLEFLSF